MGIYSLYMERFHPEQERAFNEQLERERKGVQCRQKARTWVRG
jgi:hypothetical protein